MTPDQFRIDFPEFSDVTVYPDTLVTYWIAVAANLVNLTQWAALATLAQELVTAHFLVLAIRDQNAAANNVTPGTVTGVQTAKSVGTVSASYDPSTVTFEGAALWNQTSYGIRYLSLARLIGAGGLQFPQTCEF